MLELGYGIRGSKMRANETDLGFMKASMSIEIPYFQRGYVWDEENWEELLDNLLDDKRKIGRAHV